MEETRIIYTPEFPQLAYRKIGNGPVIVLLHGFPESGRLWYKVWPLLAKSFTVIVPDFPGTGGSAFIGEDLTVEKMASSVKAILDSEGIDKAVIAGHSMGGYAAIAFAELYKPMVKGLCMLHSLAGADNEERKELRLKSIELIRKGGKDAFVKQMIPNLFSTAFKKQHPDEVSAQISGALELPPESLIAFYNAMINRPDRTSILQGVVFPLQWLIGKEDTIATPEKVTQQSLHANVNFVSVYTDCAHMGMLEKTSILVNDLKSFADYSYSR